MNDYQTQLFDYYNSLNPIKLLNELTKTFGQTWVEDILEIGALKFGLTPIPTVDNDEDYSAATRKAIVNNTLAADDMLKLTTWLSEAMAERRIFELESNYDL